jgi:hypothetical protein
MAFDRKQYAGELQKRVKESHDTKDQGLFGGSIFKADANLPMWKCTEGKHYIDVIPYIAGPNHPRVKEGRVAHNLDIWVHYQIGPNNLPFVCLAKNYNQPCPICDYRKELEGSEQADEDVLKSFLPKRRTIYNIVVYDNNKEEEKGIQVWDVSHFFFEQKIASIAERPRQGGFVNWPDPDDGKQVMFERKGSGANNTQFLGHAFVDRDYTIDDEILKEAICLDDLIIIPDYEEVETILHGRAAVKKEEIKEEKQEEQKSGRRPLRQQKEVEKTEEPECPGDLGKDIDKFDQCQECKKYDDCANEYERLEKEEAEKKVKRTSRLRR